MKRQTERKPRIHPAVIGVLVFVLLIAAEAGYLAYSSTKLSGSFVNTFEYQSFDKDEKYPVEDIIESADGTKFYLRAVEHTITKETPALWRDNVTYSLDKTDPAEEYEFGGKVLHLEEFKTEETKRPIETATVTEKGNSIAKTKTVEVTNTGKTFDVTLELKSSEKKVEYAKAYVNHSVNFRYDFGESVYVTSFATCSNSAVPVFEGYKDVMKSYFKLASDAKITDAQWKGGIFTSGDDSYRTAVYTAYETVPVTYTVGYYEEVDDESRVYPMVYEITATYSNGLPRDTTLYDIREDADYGIKAVPWDLAKDMAIVDMLLVFVGIGYLIYRLVLDKKKDYISFIE